MVELSMNEITVKIEPKENNEAIRKKNEWSRQAERIIGFLEINFGFNRIFHRNRDCSENVHEEVISYTYGFLDDELTVYYYPSSREKGVILHITDDALQRYLEKTEFTFYEFFQKLYALPYNVTLTAIRLTALYIHEGVNLEKLHDAWINGAIGIKCQAYTPGKLFTMTNCKPTVWTRWALSNEVIAMDFPLIKDAVSLTIHEVTPALKELSALADRKNFPPTHVRLELFLKKNYATAIFGLMQSVHDDEYFAQLVTGFIGNMARFYMVDNGRILELLGATKILENCVAEKNYVVTPAFDGKQSLVTSIKSLTQKSEMFSIIYKVHDLWGEEGIRLLKKHLTEEYARYSPEEGTEKWLNHNRSKYKANCPTAKDFFTDNNLSKVKEE